MTGRRDRTQPQAEKPGSSLLTNTSWLLASRLAQAALGWAGTVFIARTLDVEEFGRFTLIFTILGLMSVITDMGIGRIAVKGMLGETEHDTVRFAGAYLGLRTALGVLGYVVVMLVVVLLGYPPEVVTATAVAAVVVLLATPSSALDVVFQARMRMGTVSASGVAGLVAQLALTAAIAAGGGGTLLLFTIPAVLCEVVILCWKVPIARRLVPLRFVFDRAIWLGLLREALPLTLGIGLATVYYRVDAVMLSLLDSFDAVGIYGVSYKFVDVMHFAAVAVTVPLLTVLVRAWPDDPGAFRDAVRRSAMLLGLLGGAAAMGLLAFAEPATTLLYGETYAVGEHATRVLAVAQVLTLFGSLALTCLIAVARNRIYPVVMLAGLVVNVSANLVLIPRYSYEGAAAATLASEVLVLSALLVLVFRVPELRTLRLGRIVVVPLAVGAGVLAGHAADDVVPWPVAAVVALLAFLAVAVGGGLVSAAGIPVRRALRRGRQPAAGGGG